MFANDRLGHCSRRGFLHGAAAALGVAGVARGIEPIVRSGGPKFKFSLAAYSYRDLLQAKTNRLTLSDFVVDCAKFGLEGTELTSYYFPTPLTDDYLRQLKGECFRLGLDVSGTAVGNDFCQPPGPKRDKELAHVKAWVDHAVVLGAPIIRVFSGSAQAGQSPAEAHKLAVAGLEECCAYAGEKGVFLALENHGGLTATADSMLALVRDVRSPWFAVNLDTGNFHSADVYGELARLAPYAMNVQVKVVVQPEGSKRLNSDYARLAKILREVNYRGYIVLEFEEPEPPREACPRHLDALRKAFLS